MGHTDLLNELGMTEKEISQFNHFEREGNKREQERILRSARGRILEGIHSEERLIGKLDFYLNQIKNN